MSSSESDGDDNIDLSNFFDDPKPDPDADGVKQETTKIKQESILPGAESEMAASNSKSLAKEQRKLNKLKERELRTEIFGDKRNYLKRLRMVAATDDELKAEQKKRKADANKRQAVWSDDDDHGRDVFTRIDNYKCEVTQKEQHKKLMENKFHRILGTPAWADLNKRSKRGVDDSDEDSDSDHDDDDDEDDKILRTVGHIAQSKGDRLGSGQLQFKRQKDLNRETYGEGPSITSLVFHPTSMVGLVAGTKGISTIYSVDGKKNEKLHSMAFQNFPIRCARLSSDGNKAIFGGSQKYFYTYDLLSGHTQRIFLPKTLTKIHNFEISPCGKYFGVIGRFGEVHLLHTSTMELLCTLKQEHDATSVAFSIDSKYLFTHCVDSEVNVFAIGEQRFSHRFIDDGCVNGTVISISPNGQLVAAASQQGVCNVYNYNDVLREKCPKPLKTILNLTTSVTSATFNHSSELLSIASRDVENAIRIVHFPSGTVYHNFPGMNSNIGKPNVVQFSPQSGYFAIGNGDKQVPLFRLKHFNNY